MRSLAVGVATLAIGLVVGCTSGTATVTGTLVGADGNCLYVDVSDAGGTVRYWLRNLPSDYEIAEVGELGIVKPDGSRLKIGDALTVSGTVSRLPFERQCTGAHTLDATAVN